METHQKLNVFEKYPPQSHSKFSSTSTATNEQFPSEHHEKNPQFIVITEFVSLNNYQYPLYIKTN
jgi:hypothetical protein